MTDVQIAQNNLDAHTLCLCKDGRCLYSEKRGIAPIMDLIDAHTDLNGYSVADTVVGKAAALLFVRCGIRAVFAKTLSAAGKQVLERYAVPFTYTVLTAYIVNREGTDMCPMEKAVLSIDDAQEAYAVLQKTLQGLRGGAPTERSV